VPVEPEEDTEVEMLAGGEATEEAGVDAALGERLLLTLLVLFKTAAVFGATALSEETSADSGMKLSP